MSAERWRPVVGYEGAYEVSDLGRVRSLDRLDRRGSRVHGKVLMPHRARWGHLRVTLAHKGRPRHWFVHRLVLLAFVGVPADGLQACHNDGDPSNNALANLRWDTQSSNAKDRRRHGTDPSLRRTECPQGHAYDESNTYFTAQGWRLCRECCLARARAYHARRKAA